MLQKLVLVKTFLMKVNTKNIITFSKLIALLGNRGVLKNMYTNVLLS